MYLVLVKPFCMQNPIVSCGWNHDVPSFISILLVSPKTVLNDPTRAHHCSGCVWAGGSETRWEINQLIVKATTTWCAWIVTVLLEWLDYAARVTMQRRTIPSQQGAAHPLQVFYVHCALWMPYTQKCHVHVTG